MSIGELWAEGWVWDGVRGGRVGRVCWGGGGFRTLDRGGGFDYHRLPFIVAR